MKPDDRLDDPHVRAQVRAEARRALEAADAIGVLPTPIDVIVEAAKHSVYSGEDIDEGFIRSIGRRSAGLLKQALSKVWGVLDVGGRIMHLDKLVPPAKAGFLKIHELAHGLLVWQKDVYAVTADCEKTLLPEVADAFDRQANEFASEVIFQLEHFTEEASDHPFGIRTPLKLSRTYGASVYSTLRRYVTTNGRACAVVVLEPPVFKPGDGFTAEVRRVVYSERFRAVFGCIEIPKIVTPDDDIGAMVPVGPKQKMSRPREIRLEDRNGTRHLCVAEAFRYKYYVFVLIHQQVALTRKQVVVPA